jgi:ABC-type multidrug transport system fused ATPase/permease subunit
VARAVYSDADIYLIDDCLSALDMHVGQKVFKNVIQGELRGKTRILVTHALSYVHEFDEVLVMREGQIVDCGIPKELLQKNEGELCKLIVGFENERKKEVDIDSSFSNS